MILRLKPRRGKRSTAENQNIVLEKGELFLETPDNGEGKGTGKIKMGDGTTAYSNLPYFMEQKEEYKGTKEYINSIIDTIPEGSAIDITDDQFSGTIKNTVSECVNSTSLDDIAGAKAIKEINTELSNKASSNHNHDDRYYTETEVNNLLNGKAASNHNHDSVYQAKGNYAAASHNHDDRYFTETEVNNLLNGKAASNHTHNYAASSHNHDDRYYTESEVNNLLNSRIGGIGNIVNGDAISSAVNANTWVSLAKITLTAGTWCLYRIGSWQPLSSYGTPARYIAWSTTQNSGEFVFSSLPICAKESASTTINLSGTTTIFISYWFQNASSNGNKVSSNNWKAVKIAN